MNTFFSAFIQDDPSHPTLVGQPKNQILVDVNLAMDNHNHPRQLFILKPEYLQYPSKSSVDYPLKLYILLPSIPQVMTTIHLQNNEGKL